jgi:hypothetical protein
MHPYVHPFTTHFKRYPDMWGTTLVKWRKSENF